MLVEASRLHDGAVITAVEEKRVNRIKHAPYAKPLQASRYCLREGALNWNIWTRLCSP